MTSITDRHDPSAGLVSPGGRTISQPKTHAVCEKFGIHARFLSSVGHYNSIHAFVGLALPVLAEDGREQLDELPLRDARDHVVVIDGMHHGGCAVFGRQEAASARAGGACAVIVLGFVAQVAALQTERLPIMARSTNPRMIPAAGGTARLHPIDAECGIITREHYVAGDSDEAVMVERQFYQQKMPLR